MTAMRPIDIDFEVHQRIELARTSFEESPNDVLRRLLGISARQPQPHREQKVDILEGRPWSGKGVTLPHGTELRMEYNGKVYSGSINQGEWLVEGMRAKSPSDAACSVASTKDGSKPSLNGWVYWQVKRPGDRTWKPIDSLRR